MRDIAKKVIKDLSEFNRDIERDYNKGGSLTVFRLCPDNPYKLKYQYSTGATTDDYYEYHTVWIHGADAYKFTSEETTAIVAAIEEANRRNNDKKLQGQQRVAKQFLTRVFEGCKIE